MSFEQILVSRLTGFAGLNALVGSRISQTIFPQGSALPAIRFTLVGVEVPRSMSADDGIRRATFQFDVAAETATNANAVEIQLRNALRRWVDVANNVRDTFLGSSALSYDDDREQYLLRLDVEFILDE